MPGKRVCYSGPGHGCGRQPNGETIQCGHWENMTRAEQRACQKAPKISSEVVHKVWVLLDKAPTFAAVRPALEALLAGTKAD